MKVEKVEEEKKKTGRPSKLRGAYQNLPKARTIPDEAFTCEQKLMDFIYGDKLWEELCLGTNCTADKLEPESVFLPISIPTMIEFFGHLLLLWAFKPESMDIYEFWVMFRACPKAFGFEGFNIFHVKNSIL